MCQQTPVRTISRDVCPFFACVTQNHNTLVYIHSTGLALFFLSAQNGIYQKANNGSYVRTDDFPEGSDQRGGVTVTVREGTSHASKAFALRVTENEQGELQPDVVGSDSLTWDHIDQASVDLSVAAGKGLEYNGNQLNVDLASESGLQFVVVPYIWASGDRPCRFSFHCVQFEIQHLRYPDGFHRTTKCQS